MIGAGIQITLGNCSPFPKIGREDPLQERLVMGLIPGYEKDIFISYAHNYNLSVFGFKWVDWFHENLENLLIGKLGERPVIWRDPRMDQTDLIEGLLDSCVNTSTLMLVIVSPAYFKSKWCGWEREKFVENAARRGGLRVLNKSRIIKVVKAHDERTVLPEELQETLGGEFLRHEQAAGRYVELDPQSSECQQKLGELADSIKSLIEAFKDHMATAVPLTKEKTVYLAETDSELDPERNDIKREFEQNGYHILPSVDLPLRATAAEIEEKVRYYLESAQVSVHLLGANYGFVPNRERAVLSSACNTRRRSDTTLTRPPSKSSGFRGVGREPGN